MISHIETAAWKTVGDLLESSGWTEALAQVIVGMTDSLILLFPTQRITCQGLMQDYFLGRA